jgi:hypothetical protein
MASFNGTDLGFIFSMLPSGAPYALQVNAYPGANGLEVLPQGTRGGSTSLHGGTIAANPAALAVAEQVLRTMQESGVAATLIDQLGTSWSNVIFLTFSPLGNVTPMAGGGYGRQYSAEFFHTS